MVEANAAAVTGPTLGAVQSLPTVSSLLARCSSLLSSQATCLLTSSRTASSGATSDFSRPPDRELLDPPAETLRVAALDSVAFTPQERSHERDVLGPGPDQSFSYRELRSHLPLAIRGPMRWSIGAET